MKKEEIKKELELEIRAFLEAKERSTVDAIDDFEETRILESAFNRLFLAVEHLCNALVLLETGNFSPKHFGDLKKLKELKAEYKTDFQMVYEKAYAFRGYDDYRKFPEVEEKFNRENLQQQLSEVQQIMNKILEIVSKKIDVSYLIDKSAGRLREEQRNKKRESS